MTVRAFAKRNRVNSLSWDPLSRFSQVVAGSTTLNYQYDGADLAVEYIGSAFRRRHIFGPGLDEPVVTYESSGVASWPLADHLGSTTGFSDNAGALTAARGFDEFGRKSADIGRFQYTGQAWLPDENYHYKARAYSAALGRFLQTDPIGFGGGMNLYAYVGNDPVNFVDALGLDPRPPQRPQSCEGTPTEACGRRRPFASGAREVDAVSPVVGLLTGRATGKSPFNFMPIDRPEVETREKQPDGDSSLPCLDQNSGPVTFKGGAVDLVLGAGVGFAVYQFEVPGGSGIAVSGAGLGGLGGFVGGEAGAVDTLGHFLGPGYRGSITFPAFLGASALFAENGDLIGGTGSFGYGAYAYAGKTHTRVLSSSSPICPSN